MKVSYCCGVDGGFGSTKAASADAQSELLCIGPLMSRLEKMFSSKRFVKLLVVGGAMDVLLVMRPCPPVSCVCGE